VPTAAEDAAAVAVATPLPTVAEDAAAVAATALLPAAAVAPNPAKKPPLPALCTAAIAALNVAGSIFYPVQSYLSYLKISAWIYVHDDISVSANQSLV